MGLLDRRGDRGGALRVYSEWQARLAEEFGVEPDPETRKLARRIQASRKGESNEPLSEEPLPYVDVAATAPALATTPVETRVAGGSLATRSVWRTWAPYIGIGVLIGVLGAGGAIMRLRDDSGRPNSIAVLPLTVIGDSTPGGVAQAVAEEMTTALAQDSTLIVHSASDARDPTPDRDAGRIGRNLGVAYVVVGAVQRGGERVRVTLQLVETRNAVAAWARSFEVDASNAGLLGQRIASDAAPVISSVIARSRLP